MDGGRGGGAGGGKPESSKSLNIPVQQSRNVRAFEEEDEGAAQTKFHPAPRYVPRHHSRDFQDEDEEVPVSRERRNTRGKGEHKSDEERFLDVDLPEGVLNLGSVVLRDVHVLRKFDVANRSPSSPLHLTLASTLPDEQVGFQLTNANLQGELEEEDHNQLFNTINRINELTLAPLERRTIILSFLPISQMPDAEAAHHEDEDEAPHDTRTSYTAKGEITITARPLKGDARTQTTVLTLLAKVCKLEMKVDATEFGFDNCLVGGSYVKDFTIRNHSEIPLLFGIKTDTVHHGASSKEKVLDFVDYDTGSTVRDYMIPSFSHITIRVTYRPAEVGNFSYVVRIENVKDPNSVHFINIHSSVVSELRPKSIMLSVAKLDFGDCYTSVPVYQILTVKNVTEDTMEVYFDSDASHEVSFDLITESDQQEEERQRTADEAYDSDSNSTSESEADGSDSDGNDDRENELSTTPDSAAASGNKTTAKVIRHSRIEEISLGPGAEKTIKVWYNPEPEEVLASSTIVPGSEAVNRLATLSQRSFQIDLTCKNREGQVHTRKSVAGTAKVCTSFVYVPRTEINLGDCDVGSWRSAVVELVNLSDLPAKVALNYQSKVVTFRQRQVTIPPRQSADLKLDFVPRKINPDYRKEITFVNTKNKSNDQFVSVRANNIDPLRITFHSVFYHLITPYSHNYLDFENVIVGSPAVRTFLIRNVSGKDLKLEFKTSLADEITLCKQGASAFLSQSPQSKTEQLMQRIEDHESRLQPRDSSKNAQTPIYLDLADSRKPDRSDASLAKRTNTKSGDLLQKKPREQQSQAATLLAESEQERQRRRMLESGDDFVITDFSDEASRPATTTPSNDLASLTRRLSYTGSLPDSMTADKEEQYIMSQERRFKGVMRALNEGLLVPLTGKSLHLLPDEECMVYAVFRPSPTKRGWLQGKLKKIKGSISIRLVDYDRATLRKVSETSEGAIPPRDLMVTANICRSVMELAQKNINFGTVFKHTKHPQKTLVINNLSEVPLVYRVKKSGSIASLDLIISKADRMGIIRPYRRKELHFLFKPTITGAFNEKLVIENIQDASNNQVITVKALVKPTTNFFVRSMSMDFGVAVLGMRSKRCQLIVSNTTNQRRLYEVKLDDTTGACEYDLLLRLEKTAPIVLTKEEEVQVAHLLQRIKIARRKAQEEKIAKYMEQLNKLQTGKIQKESPGSSNVTSGYSSDVDEGEERKDRSNAKLGELAATMPKRIESMYSVHKNVLSLHIDGGGACSVLAVLRPKAIKRDMIDVRARGVPLEGRVLIYETKNVDMVKTIPLRATVCATHEDYVKLALSEPHMADAPRDDVRDLLAAQAQDVSGSSPLTGDKEGAITPPNSPIANSPLDYLTLARLEAGRATSPSSSPLRASDGVSATMQELEISPMSINFGAVKLGKSVSSKFTVRNSTAEDVPYAIFEVDERHSTREKKGDAVVSVKEEGGMLKAHGTKDVVFSITPHDTGRQTYNISVMNMKTMTPRIVSVTLSVEKSRGLRYPDLPVTGGQNGSVDLGLCYINGARNEYAKVHPFRIQNLSSTALVLAAQSNMPSQVFLFQDSELTQHAVGILLPPRKITTIYICLQPNKKRLNKTYADGTCRDIVGGIRIKAIEADSLQDRSVEALFNEEKSLVPTYEETIKFTAVLGKSVLSVSHHTIDLGTVTSLVGTTVKGYFELQNMSLRLPLEWFIPTPKLFSISRLRGHLKPRASPTTPSADSCQKIEVSLIPRHYGYFEEEIKVYNTHSRDPALRVKVCLFVEEKLVRLDTSDGAGEPAKEAASDSAASAPLDFGCVYLRPRKPDETTVGEDTVAEGKAKEKEKDKEREKAVEREREKVERAESEESVEYDAEDEIDEVYSETSTDEPELEINSSNDVSDSGVRWKTVVVENISNSDLLLRARTEFDLGVMWRQHSEDGQTDDQQLLLPVPATHDQGEKGATKDQLLKPGQKARLLVSLPLPTHKTLLQHVTTSQAHTRPQRLVNSLLQGQRVDVLGNLFLERHVRSKPPGGREKDTLQCCRIIPIKASYAISMARLHPQEVKLDAISDVWKAIPFEFTVQNLSNAPLVCKLNKLPLEVTIDSPALQKDDKEKEINKNGIPVFRTDEVTNAQLNSLICVPPSGSVLVNAALHPSEINYALQDNYTNAISLVNVHNSFAPPMLVPIHASVNLYHLKYLGLSGDGDLVLPTLMHPAPPNAPPVDEWFTVQNTSGRALDIEIQGQLNMAMADLIALQILSRESNLPLKKFTLAAGDSLEIKIRVEARKDARIPSNFGKKYKDFPLGKLHLRSEHVAETILVHGSLEPGPTFALSTTRLHFRSDAGTPSENASETQSHVVRVRNLLSQFPVQVQFSEQPVQAQRASPRSDSPNGQEPSPTKAILRGKELSDRADAALDQQAVQSNILDVQPDKATIPPGESIDVVVTLRDRARTSSSGSSSEDRTLVVSDVRSSSMPQHIAVTHSRLEVHKTVSGRQGVELDTRSLALNKKKEESAATATTQSSKAPRLALRGCTPITSGHKGQQDEELSYRYEINLGQHVHGSGPVNWTLTLESLDTNEPTSSLEFKIYSLKDNDKTWMTVGRNRGILSSAGEYQQVPLIFATDKVDFYSTYLMIQNLDNPHDLKTIRIHHEVVSQEKLLYGVLVDGKQAENPVIDLGDVYYDQVYRDHSFIILNQSDMALDFLLTDDKVRADSVEVGFSLSQTTLKIFNALNIEARRSAQAPSGDAIVDYDAPVEKTIGISVSCRLVKDHKATIQLRARVWPSSLKLSTYNLAYRGRLNFAPSLVTGPGNDSVASVDLADEAKEIVVHNTANRPTKYRVVNDCLFFTVEADEGEIPEGGTAKVLVRPNMAAIHQNRRLFLKEKYIEEHVTVYSFHPQRFTERSFVAIRLVLGHLPSDVFYTSPGAKNAYPFLTLEERIVCFMRDLNLFFTRPGPRVQGQPPETDLDEASSREQHQRNPLGAALLNISNQQTDTAARQRLMDQMSFELHFITDQLGFYGLKKQTGGNALRLAHLLFSGLQKQYDVSALIHKWGKSKQQQPSSPHVREGSKVLLFMIDQWAGRLSYFVGLFPEANEDLELLRVLRAQLRAQSDLLQTFLQGAAGAAATASASASDVASVPTTTTAASTTSAKGLQQEED